MEAIEWKPKNGERVWVKVFSNWSLGTYVGYDVTINKHYVREDADGGGSLMSSSLVLPESANPNVPKELTAVEWLVYHLQKSKDWQRVLNEVSQMSTIEFDLIQQAKEMEREQIIAFGKKCFYKGFEKAENDDANCFTAWREEANELLTFKSE